MNVNPLPLKVKLIKYSLPGRNRLLLLLSFILFSFPVLAQDYFKLGCDAQDKAQLDKAIYYYSKKIAQDAGFTRAYINKGLCYQDKAEYDSALSNFQTALKLQPGDPAIHMSLGTVYFHQKKYHEALENLETALRKAPNNVNGQYDLGMTRHELKDYRGAISAFNGAINLDPKKEKFYYARALSKDQLRDYTGALQDCNAAIQLKHDYEKAFFLRAKEENELQLYRNALADMEILVKINPGNTRYYAEKGEIEYHIGYLNDCITDCNKAIRLYDGYGNPFYSKAMAERDSGLVDSALADIKKANELFKGKSALVWYESGTIKLLARDYPGAHSDFQNALNINPGYSFASYGLVTTTQYLETNDRKSIYELINKIIKSEDHSCMGYYLLGRYIAVYQNNPEEAKSNFEKAIGLRCDSSILAICYARLGDITTAEKIMNQRITRFEKEGLRIKNREAYVDLALIYAIQKDAQKCIKCLNEALSEGYSLKYVIEISPEFIFLAPNADFIKLKKIYGIKEHLYKID